MFEISNHCCKILLADHEQCGYSCYSDSVGKFYINMIQFYFVTDMPNVLKWDSVSYMFIPIITFS